MKRHEALLHVQYALGGRESLDWIYAHNELLDARPIDVLDAGNTDDFLAAIELRK